MPNTGISNCFRCAGFQFSTITEDERTDANGEDYILLASLISDIEAVL